MINGNNFSNNSALVLYKQKSCYGITKVFVYNTKRRRGWNKIKYWQFIEQYNDPNGKYISLFTSILITKT